MATIDQQRDATGSASSRMAALVERFDPSEPHTTSGPFARWPRATDAMLATIVFALTLVFVAVSRLDDGETFRLASIVELPTGAVGLSGVGAAALWWRRARPVAVTAVMLTGMVVWALAGYGDGNDLILVVAIYSVGRYCTDHRLSLAAVIAAFLVSALGSIIDANQRIDVLPAVLLTALPWYVGRRVRNRGDYLRLLQERAERLEAEQHARAREAVAAERSRIARELHDVVAHQVSMMTVQAGAAKTIARTDFDTAVEAMADVERAGRSALGELRHLLGVLRHDSADPDHLGPPHGLDDIAPLVDQLANTGADVTFTAVELPDHISTAVDLSGYRIVQESVTNIVKHAGPDPTVDVSLAVDGDTLVIEVTNTVAVRKGSNSIVATPDLPSSGFGTVGMRERAALLGGTIAVGPLPPDRYRITARLPLQPDTT